MKPGLLLALCCAASLAAAPALAQHSASGRIAAPAATVTAVAAKPAAEAAAAAPAGAATTANATNATNATASVPASLTLATPVAPAPSVTPATPAASAGSAASTLATPAATTTAPAGTTLASAPVTAAPPPAMPGSLAVASGSGTSAAGSLLQTTLALAFVLALLIGVAWFLKRYGPKSLTGSTAVKLVGTLNVGARERILVVEVGEQWIVVGASPGRMNALATMPRQEHHASTATTSANALGVGAGANFAEWFKQTIEKRNGNSSNTGSNTGNNNGRNDH